MQYAKEDVRQRIIDAARNEFLEMGFERASIRAITARAGTSKSNLYNYFSDKDALFYSVLEPTVTMVRKGLELSKSYDASQSSISYTRAAQMKNIEAVTRFVSQNGENIRLLLFHAQGSRLENFKSDVMNAFTDIMFNWVQAVRPERQVSWIFVRCIAGFYVSVLEQAVLFGVDAEQREKWQDELIDFIYNGWQGIFS